MGQDMLFLIPGVGAQGNDATAITKAGVNERGGGIIVNSARSVIFASSGPDFADAARRETLALREEINKARSMV
jgi:orotidine-5'-phosphate decarboxylase